MLRILTLLLPLSVFGSVLPVDQAIPVRFGARFAEGADGRVARFDEERGILLPVESAGGETEVVLRCRLPKGRSCRLEVRGHGLNLSQAVVGTGATADVVLGRGRLSPGLGRLEINAPGARGLELSGVRLPNVSATSPAVLPVSTAYVDDGKGGVRSWHRLALRAGGEARLPVVSDREGEVTLVIARGRSSGSLSVGATGAEPRRLAAAPEGGAAKVSLRVTKGTQLIRLRALDGDVAIEGIVLEGRPVSSLWSLPNGNAQSVHFGYPVPEGVRAVWAYAEAVAEPGPESTYHCVLGFNQGYFGYQVRYQRGRPDDRWFIYSLWDNGYVRNHEKQQSAEELRDKVVTLLAKGPGVNASAFDHEGSGGHSHLPFRWKDGVTYKFLLGVQADGPAAIFSAWVDGPEIGGWRFLTSFRRPSTEARLDGLHSFVEDWTGRQGDRERACRYRNLWVADADGRWSRLTQAHATATAELGRRDFSHRVVGDAVELRTGGYRHAEGRQGLVLEIPVAGSAPSVDFARLPRSGN